ncbi:MAG: vanadium-dependent haloperoxidase, partial [Acidobacteriales bacterium]|nr:vanadium-dependent haloperoxidase [Terriglobales bacterium]
YNLRVNRAQADFSLAQPPHTTNGDEQRYSDKSASYSKGLLQDDIGVVNPAAWISFKQALRTGDPADWNKIIIGGTRTENGPQGAYALDLEAADSALYGDAPFFNDPGGLKTVPPFDPIESDKYGAQLAEVYWSSLLYDVAFTDDENNDIANQAAAELTSFGAAYRGPKTKTGQVTPNLLFRGIFPGEQLGPYVSQFFLMPTYLGTQKLDMLMQTFVPGVDYLTDVTTYQQVQNGISTGLSVQFDPVARFLHDARGFAAYTHVDVLFQAYFTGFLVMLSSGFPLNPGNPYTGNKTQNGFNTFGGPDFAASQGEIATRALAKVWFQKWLIHLAHRPEAGGGVLQQILTGNGNKIQAKLNSNILNSAAPQQVFSKYGTYLLPHPYPEGSPTHPSYPTGHGTVAGACITLLKFFYDGNHVIDNPVQPSADGLTTVPYTGGDTLTVNGELNKLAHNVTFGHGILAGTHWRTDSDASMTLGEACALSWLQNRALTYNEKFTIQLQRLDGSMATISNQ